MSEQGMEKEQKREFKSSKTEWKKINEKELKMN